jgi:hypothetical protein
MVSRGKPTLLSSDPEQEEVDESGGGGEISKQ